MASRQAVLVASRREIAVRTVESVGYRGAGMVEFLVQDGASCFLEMHTRIQVEHPVTEMTSGIDLVQWQFRMAARKVLPFGRDGIEFTGNSIECRITPERHAEPLEETATAGDQDTPDVPPVLSPWQPALRGGWWGLER